MRRGTRKYVWLIAAVAAIATLPMAASADHWLPAPTFNEPNFVSNCYSNIEAPPVGSGNGLLVAGTGVPVNGTATPTAIVHVYYVPVASLAGPSSPFEVVGSPVVTDALGVWDLGTLEMSTDINADAVDVFILVEGFHRLFATTEPAALPVGHESLPEARDFCVDTVAPAAPTGLTVSDANPADAPCITNPFTISGPVGSVEPLANVVVAQDGALNTAADGDSLWTARANRDGSWSISAFHEMPIGDHSVTIAAFQRDGGRNSSAFGTAVTFLVCDDKTPPAAPEITSPADGSLSDATLHITGTVVPEPGIQVFVRERAGSPTFRDVAAIVDDVTGDWFLDETFPSNGLVSLTAYAVDANGNVSVESSPPVTVTIDVQAPQVYVTLPSGYLGITGEIWLGSPQFVQGTALDNLGVAFIEVSYDGGPPVIAACAGCPATEVSWSDEPSLATGIHTITAVSVDLVGNRSKPDSIRFLVIDLGI